MIKWYRINKDEKANKLYLIISASSEAEVGAKLGELYGRAIKTDISKDTYLYVFDLNGDIEKNIVEKLTKSSDWTLPLNPDFTFANFVVGPSNRFAHAACISVAENPGKSYNPLFIYGPVGVGKTHLMQAIGNHILKTHPSARVVYMTAERLVNDIIEAIKNNALEEMRARYKSIDLLLLDDVQFLSETERAQIEFFHIFNVMHQNNKQVVLTSDRSPKELRELEDRLRSRFEWGLVVDVKVPDYETRIAIIKLKEKFADIDLDDETLRLIATKLTDNVREIEGFLKKISLYAKDRGVVVNAKSVRELLEEMAYHVSAREAGSHEDIPQTTTPVYIEAPKEDLKEYDVKLMIPEDANVDVEFLTNRFMQVASKHFRNKAFKFSSFIKYKMDSEVKEYRDRSDVIWVVKDETSKQELKSLLEVDELDAISLKASLNMDYPYLEVLLGFLELQINVK